MITLDYDPAFADFNFCRLWDPALRGGPNCAGLYKLVYKARKGDRFAAGEFADTMDWTLRPETWECFQRRHGFRPVSHREWFFAKLIQFFDVLVYDELTITDGNGQTRKLQPNEFLQEEFTVVGGDGPLTQPEELEQALVAEEYARYPWYDLVRKVVESPTDRVAAAQAWLREQRLAPAGDQAEQPRNGWGKNQERDQVILNCLGRGMAVEQVCAELDKRTTPTLPALQAKSIHRWTDGWADPKGRKAIQQLFSKVPKRRNLVNPSAISK
jgi:hypothetical protein